MFSLQRSFALLSVLSLFIAQSAIAKASTPLGVNPAHIAKRDAYTQWKKVDNSFSLKRIPTPLAWRNTSVYPALNINFSGGELFTWSANLGNDSELDTAHIIIHGMDRNASDYIFTIAEAWYNASMDSTSKSAFLAPTFFSTKMDAHAMNDTTLGWGDPNAYQAGEASTSPPGVQVSSFTVLDGLLEMFSDKSKYPSMKKIIFIGHSGGAQLISRYAVVGKDPSSDVQVRYVLSNPSTALYFTKDRPEAVDPTACSGWDSYRYSLKDYTPSDSYPLPLGGNPTALFKRFAKRDVRYIIGDSDDAAEGDQSCMAKAAGGVERSRRSQAYWKYINLLGDHPNNADVSKFPGRFPALERGQSSDPSLSPSSTGGKDDSKKGKKNSKRAHKSSSSQKGQGSKDSTKADPSSDATPDDTTSDSTSDDATDSTDAQTTDDGAPSSSNSTVTDTPSHNNHNSTSTSSSDDTPSTGHNSTSTDNTTSTGVIPQSTKKIAELFKGTQINHRFALVPGGHSQHEIYLSADSTARDFLWKDREELQNTEL